MGNALQAECQRLALQPFEDPRSRPSYHHARQGIRCGKEVPRGPQGPSLPGKP